MTDELLVERRAGVLVMTINRPEAKNAVTEAIAHGIAAAIDELDRFDDLKVGVLTGAGGAFCSGMDLKGYLRGEVPIIEGRGLAGLTLRPPRKPLIAAVEGWALAGGFEIVLACDLVVAARTARFGLPEVKRGQVAGAGGALLLPGRVPLPIALELLLTGDPISADRAHQLGLVNRVVAEGDALASALELAAAIAANGPLAVAVSKQIARSAGDWKLSEGWVRQEELLAPVWVSEDVKEGALAFAQKRPPQWTGR
ncbi:Carnitinyl-CoA dehydratase [metagenome]|uniref:Carnitinyl-CoA dehydratase n=1 Tax=metagenome TaxID=256318 RepID=A0A2P2C4D2_9ZZZZ